MEKRTELMEEPVMSGSSFDVETITDSEHMDYPAATDNYSLAEIEEDSFIIKLKNPVLWEGKEYKEIDLSNMSSLTGRDMIAINKYMARSQVGVDVMPEVSMEYAFHFASKATRMPIEFFMDLPPRVATRVKNRVMGFLFSAD